MPNTDRLQPDFNQEPDSNHQQKSNALSREIDNLQTGIRIDFDQKLAELTDLLQRFKAMVVSPNRSAANGPSDAPLAQVIPFVKSLPTAESTPSESEIKPVVPIPANSTSTDTLAPTTSAYSAETARFENGLYRLNSQLYRFRLELDQEMEFREEPLHIHFSQESELSILLQQINNRSIEKNPDN